MSGREQEAVEQSPMRQCARLVRCCQQRPDGPRHAFRKYRIARVIGMNLIVHLRRAAQDSLEDILDEKRFIRLCSAEHNRIYVERMIMLSRLCIAVYSSFPLL